MERKRICPPFAPLSVFSIEEDLQCTDSYIRGGGVLGKFEREFFMCWNAEIDAYYVSCIKGKDLVLHEYNGYNDGGPISIHAVSMATAICNTLREPGHP